MESKLDWNELKLVLAISRAGSLAGASRQLGLSHATVFRHLNAVEKSLGVTLFQRDYSGYTTTSAGHILVLAAADIESRVLGVEQRLTGQEIELTGTVRVTTTDTLLFGILAPIFTDFQITYPEIKLELSVSNAVFSLPRRDADVAIRPAQKPNEHLVGRRIGVISQAVYTTPDQARDNPVKAEQRWISSGADMVYPTLEAWMREQEFEPHSYMLTNSLLATYAAVVAGAGFAVLPCYLADNDQRLCRVGDPIPELASDLWLLVHPELKRVASIKAFNDYVFAATREQLAKWQPD